ncbi:MAG TPA: hypothetical protein VJU85_01155 [Nitrososphaeraceae archaeon]|nr:hypothetical protein [Nitrososphaeraceae archaeon]
MYLGIVLSSLGNILIIEEKFQKEIDDIKKIRKYEILPNRNKKDRRTINYS